MNAHDLHILTRARKVKPVAITNIDGTIVKIHIQNGRTRLTMDALEPEIAKARQTLSVGKVLFEDGTSEYIDDNR